MQAPHEEKDFVQSDGGVQSQPIGELKEAGVESTGSDVQVSMMEFLVWSAFLNVYKKKGAPISVEVLLQLAKKAVPVAKHIHSILARLERKGLLQSVNKSRNRARIPIGENRRLFVGSGKKRHCVWPRENPAQNSVVEPSVPQRSPRKRGHQENLPITERSDGALCANPNPPPKITQRRARLYEALMAKQREVGYQCALSSTQVRVLRQAAGEGRNAMLAFRNYFHLVQWGPSSKEEQRIVFSPYVIAETLEHVVPPECTKEKTESSLVSEESATPVPSIPPLVHGIRTKEDLAVELDALRAKGMKLHQEQLEGVVRAIAEQEAQIADATRMIQVYQENLVELRARAERFRDQLPHFSLPDHEQARLRGLRELIQNYHLLIKS